MDHNTYSIRRYPTHLIESLVLDNGRRVTLRPVLPQDADLERAFVAALSPATRRNRFHAAINGIGALQAAQMTNIDYQGQMAFVASVIEGEGRDEHEVLVADARYSIAEDEQSAEFAIVVADGWGGLGLAKQLMALLGRCARRAGLQWLRGEVLAANEKMLGLMQCCGFRVAAHGAEPGLLIAECCVGAPIAAPRGPLARLRDWFRGVTAVAPSRGPVRGR